MDIPRLAEDAARAIDRARDEARRRGHPQVEPEHVLAALARASEHARAFVLRGIDREELRLLVESSLDRRTETSRARAYRDGEAAPPLSSALTSAIASKKRSVFARLTSFSADELLDAIVADPSTVPSVRAASTVIDPLVSTLRRVEEANDFGPIGIEHVLRYLADERWLVFATRAAGGDVARLREVLDEAIAARTIDVDVDAAAAELSTHVQRTLAHARILRTRALCDLFVIRTLQTTRLGELFDRAGVRPVWLLRVLVHGDRFVDDDALDIPGDEDVEVVFHDDDVTTMEFVVSVLSTCFAMDHDRAVAHMLAVHGHDMHVVARLPADDARGRVALARDLARAEATPLRISIRRARPRAPPR